MVPFGCVDKPTEKHCWLICYERKILFRLKKQAKNTDYKPDEQGQCPYVQWILLLLVLPCTGVLAVGVTSFREREQILGLFGGVCVLESLVSEVCFWNRGPLYVVSASPFIVFKGRARVTFVVKI
jgi:hypothetical protein